MSALPANAVSSGVIPTPNDVFGGISALQIIALVLCYVIPLIGWALLIATIASPLIFAYVLFAAARQADHERRTTS